MSSRSPTEAERRARSRRGVSVGDVAVAVQTSKAVMPDSVGVDTRNSPGIAERPTVDAVDLTSIVGIVST